MPAKPFEWRRRKRLQRPAEERQRNRASHPSKTAAESSAAPSAEAALREFHPPRPHNFARGALLSKRQLESLETTYRKSARQLTESLSGLTRQQVDVELLGVAQRTYSEFSHGLSQPTSLLVVHCLPRREPFVLELHPSVGLPLIERVLGGTADTPTPAPRPFTRIEQSVGALLADRILSVVRQSWTADEEEITFDIAEFEHNPLLIQAIRPAEPTLVLGFQLRIGRHSGRLHLCLPIRPFDDLIVGGEKTTASSSERNTEAQRQRILERLEPTELTLSAELATLPLDIGDVLTLKPGDIVATELPAQSEVRVTLEEGTTFRAQPVIRGGRRAVRILRLDAAGEA